MKAFSLGALVTLVAMTMACGKNQDDSSNSSSLHVTGSVDGRTLDNASALAIGSDGKTYTAYIRQNGSFALDLPVGHVYRIVIANSTSTGQLRTIGHLVNVTSQGTADVIAVHEGGSLNLGQLRPTSTSTSATALHPACATCSGGMGGGDNDDQGENDDDQGENDDDQGGDYKCHRDDGAKKKTCDDGDDVALGASHNPGDKCAKHDGDDQGENDDDQGENDDDQGKKASACGMKDANHDGKDDDDQGQNQKKGSNGSSGSGSGGDDDQGGSSGSCACTSPPTPPPPPPPAACSCRLQCASGYSCVASKCVADSSSPPASPTPTSPH
jgi:hypothetical protein